MVVDYLFRVVHAAVSDLDVVSVEDFSELVIPGGGGGGYLGQFLLGMCRWPLRTPTPL